MSLITITLICLAGFLGSAIDAIVGGGGLITMPALIAAGLPTHIALGTNKFASSFGTISSAYHYYKTGNVNFKLLKFLLPFSFAGSALGVLAVLSMDPEFLRIVIIMLVLLIGTYTLLKKDLGIENKFLGLTSKSIMIGIFMAFGIGFYNGFFGPGTGSFLIFALIWIYGFDFKKASANAKLMNLLGNVTALILFLLSGKVSFIVGIPMAISMIIGGKVGAKMAITKGASFIKPVFVIVSFALVIKMGIDLF